MQDVSARLARCQEDVDLTFMYPCGDGNEAFDVRSDVCHDVGGSEHGDIVLTDTGDFSRFVLMLMGSGVGAPTKIDRPGHTVGM